MLGYFTERTDMAFPSSFPESNGVLDKPSGVPSDDCSPLAVAIVSIQKSPVTISCWKLTQVELDEIVRTGRIWLGVLGTSNIPPMWVTGHNPFNIKDFLDAS